MIKLIIFDWDDVFTLGSTQGYLKCYHEALVEVGVHLGADEEKRRIFSKWGKSYREERREALKERPELLDKACEIYESKFFGDTFVSEIRIVNGAAELLQKLHSKYILCVATGMHPKLLKEVLMPRLGIPNVFSQIITAYDIEDAEKQKPHPHTVEQFLKRSGAKTHEVVMVGDDRNDVLMARAAHIEPVVVLTGHLTRKEAEELGVKHIISDVTKLEGVLSSLNSI
jgi:phosphoglycolate phosphatase-like HAD superfamily hydrolase